MGNPAKERAKALKKARKAELKAAKKRAKQQAASVEAEANSEKAREEDLAREQLRLHRWRLWAAIAGVCIALIGLVLRILSLVIE